MNTCLLILQKDLRRYAWAWLAILLFAAIDVYLLGSAAGMADTKANQILGFLSSFVGGILVFVVFVMVVQEETLADPDAYWLGRPFRRVQILLAKLAFVVMVLTVHASAEALVLILNGGAGRAPYALSSILSGLALWQGLVFLAAQTRSLPRFLLLFVCLIVGSWILSFAMIFTSFSGFDLGNPGQLPADLAPADVLLVQTLFWLFWGGLILFVFYRSRKKLHAWLLILPAILIAMVLTPKDSYFGVQFDGLDEASEPKLLEIFPTGARQTINQVSYVQYAARFEWEREDLEGALWVTVQFSNLSSADSEDVDLNELHSTSRIEYERTGETIRFEVPLGLVETDRIDALANSVDASIHLILSESEQVEIARISLDGTENVTHRGSRLAVRSYAQYDGRLNIELAAYQPRFLIDSAGGIDSDQEPLLGEFGFALLDPADGTLMPCELRHDWGMSNTLSRASATLFFPEDADPSELLLVVYSREIVDSERFYIWENGLDLTRPGEHSKREVILDLP